jgi:hypothetical protein
MPTEKIQYGAKYSQEAWLIEAKSLNGYSGSPVFCHLDPVYYRPNINPIEGPKPELGKAYDHNGNIIGQGHFDSGPYFLGVDCCMIRVWEKVCDSQGKPQQAGMQVPLNSGMMGVIPSWRLMDMMLAYPDKLVIEAEARRQLSAGKDAIPPKAG